MEIMEEIKLRQEFTNLQIGERRDVLSFNWGDDDIFIHIRSLYLIKKETGSTNTHT